jgi:hypothetical protein
MIYQIWSYDHSMWRDVEKEEFDTYDGGVKRIVTLEALFSGPVERAAGVKMSEVREAAQAGHSGD